MAILSTLSEAPRFAAAYKPILYDFASTVSPVNTAGGESGIGIVTIKVADAADVTSYGAPLEVGDVFILHGFAVLTSWTVGQAVQVAGGLNALYDGIWHVLKQVSVNVTVIDSPDNGTETIGTISKFYESYVLEATITVENLAEPVVKNIVSDADGVFTLDVSDVVQRAFDINNDKGDVFKIANPAPTFAPISAAGYITARYSIAVIQGYMIPDANGLNVFTRMVKPAPQLNVNDKVAVNAVQPYHHIDEATGEPDLLWEDNLTQYELSEGPSSTRKFLTHQPLGGGSSTYDERTAQRLGEGDACWLAFLWGQPASSQLSLRVVGMPEDGSPTFTNDAVLTLSTDESYLINVGPQAIAALFDFIPHHYRVYVVNNIGTQLTESMWITHDLRCVAEHRFYFLNSLGAIDQYTLESKEFRNSEYKRTTVDKRNMRNKPGIQGDYQRRTTSVKIVREYSGLSRSESKPVFRYLCDEFLESVDVRTLINDESYTFVELQVDKINMGNRSGRLPLSWRYGVDNEKQRR
mgnify:CR=1 FL=1